MDAHTVMEKWEGSPFDGGFDGLRDLQSRGFSGAVEAGDNRLFLRDGEPLAVVSNFEEAPREGSIEAFDGAAGRAHEAEHPGTVPLAAMLALDGEVRGRYFSDDTPLSKVHETLSGGGFTGYVELSENVLSGDYYIVYKDGDADYIGYISSSGRLITDEEAQEKAEGEIGIYEVVAVSLSDIGIPAAPEPDTGTGAVGVASESPPQPDTTTDVGTETVADADPRSEVTPEPESEPEPAAEPATQSEPATESDSTVESEPEPEPATEPEPEPAAEQDTTPTTESATETTDERDESVDSTPEPSAADGPSAAADVAEAETEESTTEPSEPTPDTEESTTSESAPETEDTASTDSSSAWQSTATTRTAQSTAESSADSDGSVMDDLTTRSVPSIDPENTGRGENGEADTAAQRGAGGVTPSEPEPTQTPDRTREPEPASASEPESTEQSRPDPDAESEPDVDVEARIEEVRQEYESELESLRAELDSLRTERDRLQERVETLEAQGTAGAGGASGVSLTPDRALAGTSLFVRDEGPGGPTLEDAHAGNVEPEELAENLRIEYHTQFEDEGATVDGEPFESFLRSSPLYAFTEWVLTDLLFEIQSTRSEGAMRPLYDALPDIDRVSFGEPVTVGEGEDQRDIEFDVVARDRMGEPLVVANMDESRDPTRAASLEPLIDDASDVGMEADRFAGAFAVTSSYFEPDALEAAREATSGSLLSREKHRNFVKLSRNNGFHLCLVESRDESFHMTMPKL
ncbi:DUF7527 domain-containing protein [Natronomonas sp.]|uniref:DUF7527 domain-containing protein n=1 Tax=Natronomonas sp. TaxID=2184060 RepID=UPI002FC3D509